MKCVYCGKTVCANYCSEFISIQENRFGIQSFALHLISSPHFIDTKFKNCVQPHGSHLCRNFIVVPRLHSLSLSSIFVCVLKKPLSFHDDDGLFTQK